MLVSALSLIINIIGLIFFHEDANGNEGQSGGGEKNNVNLQGMFLHILADTLGSISVIVSAFCIQNFGLYIADPICCFVNAFCITLSVLPLMRNTMCLLLGNDGDLSLQIL